VDILSSEEEDLENKSKKELIAENESLRNENENLKEIKKWGIIWPAQKQPELDDWEEEIPILRYKNHWMLKGNDQGPMNILIQGDNYHALAVLNYTHREKVDMIYIDPPYNTGGTMMYNNEFPSQDDSYSNSLFLSMLYHRLKIAVDLLKLDGVICCTIDDKELLAVLGIFEKLNFDIIRIVSIETKPEGRNQEKFIYGSHEYAIFAHRTGSKPNGRRIMRRDFLDIGEFKFTDPNGNSYREDTFYRRAKEEADEEDSRRYSIYANPKSADLNDENKLLELSLKGKKDWIEIQPQDDDGNAKKYGSKQMLERFIEKNKQNPTDPDLFARKSSRSGKWKVKRKIYRKFYGLPTATWTHKDYSPQSYGDKFVNNIFNSNTKTKGRTFSNPKSIFAVYDCIDLFLPENGTVLDFFVGSGTTAHATQLLNRRDEELEKAFVEKYGEEYHKNEKFLAFDAKQFCSFDPTNTDASEITKEELCNKWLEWRNQKSQRRFIVCTNNELPNSENKPDTPFNKWRKECLPHIRDKKERTFEKLSPRQQEKELDHSKGICNWITFPRLKLISKGFLASDETSLKLHFPITSLAKTYKFTKADKLQPIAASLFLKEDENGKKIPQPKQPKCTPEINSWMFALSTKNDLKKKGTKFVVPKLPFDMVFYQTDFVTAEKSFSTKHILARNAVDLYRMKEDCFISNPKKLKTLETHHIFYSKNKKKILIVVFSFEENQSIINEIKSSLEENPERKFVIYTLTTDGNDGLDEFEEIKDIATIRPIPKEIYDTYTNVETESRNE